MPQVFVGELQAFELQKAFNSQVAISISHILSHEAGSQKVAGSLCHKKPILMLLTILTQMKNSLKFVRIIEFLMIL